MVYTCSMPKKFTAKDIEDLKGDSLLNLFIVENKSLISIDLKKKEKSVRAKRKALFYVAFSIETIQFSIIIVLQIISSKYQPLSFF